MKVNGVGGFDLSSNRLGKTQKSAAASPAQGAGRSASAAGASKSDNADILKLSAVAGAATQELSFAGDISPTQSVAALRNASVANRGEQTLRQLAEKLVDRMLA